jgi:hypothetical protein
MGYELVILKSNSAEVPSDNVVIPQTMPSYVSPVKDCVVTNYDDFEPVTATVCVASKIFHTPQVPPDA